jgi:hypothetical protein
MSVATLVCPHCTVPLQTDLAHLAARCPKCGHQYHLHHTHRKSHPETATGTATATKQHVARRRLIHLHSRASVPWYHHTLFLFGVAAVIAALIVWGVATAIRNDGTLAALWELESHPDTPVGELYPRSPKVMPGQSAAVRPAAGREGALGSVQDRSVRAIYQTALPAGQSAEAAPGGSARIDELVLARLKEKGIAPAAPSSDGVFVRRVYLDVIGMIPTAAEARAFIQSTASDKREKLIDQLLERQEFSDYWAMKWGDILRVKSEFPINLWPNAVHAYHRWIRASLRENMPYDRFARALLTSSGSNFRAPPVNFYRAVQKKDARNLARAAALTFMGVRPEGWPAERWAGMETFFEQVGYKATGEWKEEIVLFDPRKPLSPARAIFPDGTPAKLLPDQDPREAFADWLITPGNPWFTRNIANRAWSWLLGRGIIHEPDDVRPDNPPSNPELLAHLEKELVAAKYDLKKLFRLILNSRTYQQSSIPAKEHPEGAALFACYPVRRLEAEVLIDAICQVTGTTERYSSPIPEPFTYIPESHRSVGLPDGSITSPFLEMFGRPPRDTGLESERNNNFTPAQRLHLLNSSHIGQKIAQGPGLGALMKSGRPPEELAEELYLAILSRLPTDDEREAVSPFCQGWGMRPGGDAAWALINSAEFLCRH